MSLGSVPVIENVITQGNCDDTSPAPLRLLKQYKAPLIYVDNWYQLYQLLKEEAQLSLDEKVERRTAVIKWYSHFKRKMSQHFIQIIRQHFFSS
ncbi:hypothetical protein L9F63_022264 [Diploptera punctata]|uniref:RXYLT1 C-terminal domain-containing protein n=1 Tax=Diploptera punctata TaxID=6984 RepID=A0AAD7ZMT9_DIPPU|nr:hypothetical protein L9F63_022264 [Diploptera punctata]